MIGPPGTGKSMLAARFPVHVTKRVRRDVTRLRRFELCKVLRKAFVHGCRRGEFRICQFSIQRDHMHVITEAESNRALSRGVQGWEIRVARRVNARLGRKGRVFADRFHAVPVRSPRQLRNTLCYVLRNASHCTSLSDRWHDVTAPPLGRSQLWGLFSRFAEGRAGLEDAIRDLATWRAPPGSIDFYHCDCVGMPEQADS